MVQVKTLASVSPDELDEAINRWIGRNTQYTILSVNPFYRQDKTFDHCATIVYEVNIPNAKKH
jgi:hypothetical protein